jgi:antitoxin MazE
MKVDLIRIGNSQGIRIPKAVIDQCGFGQRVESGSLIISPVKAARSGWAEAFKAMAEQGDDAAVFPEDLEHSFDETECEW